MHKTDDSKLFFNLHWRLQWSCFCLATRAGNAIFTALEQSQEGIEITSEDQVIQVSHQLQNMTMSSFSSSPFSVVPSCYGLRMSVTCVSTISVELSSLSCFYHLLKVLWSIILTAAVSVPALLNRSFCSDQSTVSCSLCFMFFTPQIYFVLLLFPEGDDVYVLFFFVKTC